MTGITHDGKTDTQEATRDPSAASGPVPAATVPVWDPLVRLVHWGLVIAFSAAWLSEDDFMSVHVWAGYAVVALVALRVLWGFVGTRHARFSDFVRGPAAVFGYLRGLLSGTSRRHLGHNPAGAAMTLALLMSLSATGVSGMALHAIEHDAGPFAPFFSSGAPAAVDTTVEYRSGHGDDDDEGESGEELREELWEELHEWFANLTLLLIGVHVLGVLASGWAHRENLVRAMLSGRKRREG